MKHTYIILYLYKIQHLNTAPGSVQELYHLTCQWTYPSMALYPLAVNYFNFIPLRTSPAQSHLLPCCPVPYNYLIVSIIPAERPVPFTITSVGKPNAIRFFATASFSSCLPSCLPSSLPSCLPFFSPRRSASYINWL